MVNVVVHSEKYVKVDDIKLHINGPQDMVAAIKIILDKAYYSGETICLEQHSPSNGYIEIERWK